jgi:hypothetical protein
MKVKTSNLKGRQLDWAVAKCEGLLAPNGLHLSDEYCDSLAANQDGGISEDWAQSGPILSRERISRTIDHSGLWVAYWSDGYTEGDEGKQHMQCDRSELVAGLRCVVARKLGDEVEIPEELL